MPSLAHRLQFEYQDLQWMPDDGKRRELIDGDLFVTPAPATLHQTVSRRLQYELMTDLERTGLASIFNAPVDVILDEHNVIEPDLVVVGKPRQHIVTKRAIEGVPDIVVEILTPSTSERDRHYKRRLYEQFRVPEYWVVDPDHGFVEVFALVDTAYGVRARYDRASVLVCPLFPTLSVELAPIFVKG